MEGTDLTLLAMDILEAIRKEAAACEDKNQ